MVANWPRNVEGWSPMRFVLWLGLALFFVSLGYIGSDLLTELSERTEARQAEARTDRDRVMRVLKTHERYAFYQVVINPVTDENEIEFRARARRDDISQSAYGMVRATCTPLSDAPGCWELATLFIDGVMADTPSGQPAPAAATAPAEPAAPAPSTGIVTVQPLPSAPRAEPSAANRETRPEPQAAPAPEVLRPTHVVRPSLVNARRAPQGEVETTLEGGTPLVLLDRDGAWGFFRVLEGAGSGLEIWIAFSVLDAV